MNIELLELAESALGRLVDEVVFVGGATVGLWISDPAAPPVRPTDDVDVVVVEVATRSEFHEFEAKLRDAGFSEDQASGVICRWRHRQTGLILRALAFAAAGSASTSIAASSLVATRSRGLLSFAGIVSSRVGSLGTILRLARRA